MFEPRCEQELIEIVKSAGSDGLKLSIEGAGTKAAIGTSVESARLSMRKFAGIVDYDPAELVLTVLPGTTLAEIETLVAGSQQMLAFDPFDIAPLLGTDIGVTTIGGIVASGLSGSRRVTAGAVRDHVLGLRAVSGRGEAFLAGAKVVKNVTGYDLPKLAAGSWGRLFALSEITLKVVPRPEIVRSLVVEGLQGAQLSRIMALAMGSHADVGAIAHVPKHLTGRRAMTVLRMEGFGPSVTARIDILRSLFNGYALIDEMGDMESLIFWNEMRTLARLPSGQSIWRVNIPPRNLFTVVAALRPLGASWVADWAGGLLWVAFDGEADLVRNAAVGAAGHATLIRKNLSMRQQVPALHPQAPGVAALEERVRRAFDPLALFETGRF